MNDSTPPTYSAFLGARRLAAGPPHDVARAAKQALDTGTNEAVLVFDDATGRRVDLDLSGSWDDVAARLGAPQTGGSSGPRGPSVTRRGRGRPKLGVVSKEVTLLPRHWAWLGTQRGGASATLRRLVDDARKRHEDRDQVRHAQDAAYRFMSAAVGDEPGFEEALRALYAGDGDRFRAESEGWPEDFRAYARALADRALTPSSGPA